MKHFLGSVLLCLICSYSINAFYDIDKMLKQFLYVINNPDSPFSQAFCKGDQVKQYIEDLNSQIETLIATGQDIKQPLDARKNALVQAQNIIKTFSSYIPKLILPCQIRINNKNYIDLDDLNKQLIEAQKALENKLMQPISTANGERLIKNFQGLNTSFQALKAII